jgi:membrane protein DedA with SNARE-associated domain
MISLPLNLNISGLIILFFWIIAGSLGLPGSTVDMIAEGSLATSFYAISIIIIISFIAAVIGDILAYELARKLSGRLRSRLIKFSFFKNREPRVKRLLNRYGFYMVFLTRFALTSLGAPMSYVSGLEKYSRKKFFLAVFSGELLYAIVYSLIGFTIGEIAGNLLSALNYAVLAFILILIIFYLTRHFIRKSKITKT